jgi:hypothetical protein
MCLVKNLAALPSISSDLSGKKVVVTVTNKQLYTIVTGTERYPRKVMSMRRMGQKKLAHRCTLKPFIKEPSQRESSNYTRNDSNPSESKFSLFFRFSLINTPLRSLPASGFNFCRTSCWQMAASKLEKLLRTPMKTVFTPHLQSEVMYSKRIRALV